MKKRLLIVMVVLVAGLIAVGVKRSSNRPEEGVIKASGNVEVTEVNAGFKLPGRVARLLSDEGKRVLKGDMMAVLDSAEVAQQVLQNRAFLNEAQTRFAELKTGARSQEIEQAKAQLSSTEAELEKARKDYERAGKLYGKEVISAQQVEAAKKALDVSVSQHRKALEALSLVREGPRKEEIKAAESRVRQAESALGIAEEKMKDTVIYAPLTGVVLRKNIEAGEVVQAGTPVFTIGDLGSPWIKIYVKEDKLGLVKLGQKAEVTTDSYPGRKYEGIVTYIASEAEFTPKNVQTQEERVKLVFGVKVSMKNLNDELKPGMPADVKIFLK
ncbi:MAG: efflux RND transporter periplasmic adaptor subunit [Thermodesulfovibrionales bacterium]|jgi:HlyD family secretion protein